MSLILKLSIYPVALEAWFRKETGIKHAEIDSEDGAKAALQMFLEKSGFAADFVGKFITGINYSRHSNICTLTIGGNGDEFFRAVKTLEKLAEDPRGFTA